MCFLKSFWCTSNIYPANRTIKHNDTQNSEETVGEETCKSIDPPACSMVCPKVAVNLRVISQSLEEKILDQSPWKEKMKELINDAQVCQVKSDSVYKWLPLQLKRTIPQDIYEQEPVASKSTKKEGAKQSASEATSNASNDDAKSGSKRKVKGKKSSEIVHSDSGSESKETDDDSIEEDAPPAKKSKAKKTATKKTPKVGH